MLAVAFITGLLLAERRAVAEGIDKQKITDLVFFILIASIAGARLMFVVLNWRHYAGNLLTVFSLWEGGLVFYGGLIAAIIVAVLYLRRNKLPFAKVVDIMSPPLALGIFWGRLGCFLNGCCYGVVSDRWGIRFPARDNPPVFAQQVMDGLIPPDAAFSLPVVPAQLYAALHGLVLFIILLFIQRHKKFDGYVFLMMLLLYASGRFFIESFRFYERNYFVGNMTVSQVISVILALVSSVLLVAGSMKHAGSKRSVR
jgi:phosphatidylglycerol:prolipoprotein diacylglycerol transferase